jgi:hypothetical protein
VAAAPPRPPLWGMARPRTDLCRNFIMKKTQSNLPNPKSVRRKAQTDLPLPQPMELAKLAAILRPGSKANEALKTAMEFYVEAVLFSSELPSSFEELVTKFGNDKRWGELIRKPFQVAVAKQWEDTLELDPEKNDDPARQYLAEQGLPLKKAQSVLHNVSRCYNAGSYAEIIARSECISNGKKTYAIARSVLESIARHAKRRKNESKRKSWHTQKAAKKPPQKNLQAES